MISALFEDYQKNNNLIRILNGNKNDIHKERLALRKALCNAKFNSIIVASQKMFAEIKELEEKRNNKVVNKNKLQEVVNHRDKFIKAVDEMEAIMEAAECKTLTDKKAFEDLMKYAFDLELNRAIDKLRELELRNRDNY